MSFSSKLASTTNNGTGAFVLQCRKLVFNYCEMWGSNKGMVNYIKKDLAQFARENPQIEVVVQQRKAHHPIIRGQYLNGREKVICTRNMQPNEIANKVNLLRDSSGEKLKNLAKKPVLSTTESVRGIWSPFHSNPHSI
ncbi:thioredoxin-like protein [Chlamydoabsidia padenii]|nr:thioredoxin-like protein [Chlamydoabsidia padenii]